MIAHGHQMLLITCARCGTRCRRRQNAGGDAPRYCSKTCAKGAQRQRRRAAGQPLPGTIPTTPEECPGCGELEHLKARAGFRACDHCRARLHGSCMRKTVYPTEASAAAFAVDHRLNQHPYRCVFCTHWHLTSEDTPEEMPGDAERGERMRRAGFSRPANRSTPRSKP